MTNEFSFINDARHEMLARSGYDLRVSGDFVTSSQKIPSVVRDNCAFLGGGSFSEYFIEQLDTLCELFGHLTKELGHADVAWGQKVPH